MKVIKNPDMDYAAKVMGKLKANDGYCPCRLVKTEETKCMCKEFRDMTANGKEGFCHCGLYISVCQTKLKEDL